MFGKRLVELRKEKGYNRTQFAEKIGIPATTLRNYENGSREPGHSFLVQMAEEFHVSTDYLLGLTDDRVIKTKKASSSEETEEEALERALVQNFARMNVVGRRLLVAHSNLMLKEESYTENQGGEGGEPYSPTAG